MPGEEYKNHFSVVGNLQDEIAEVKKLSNGTNNEVVTLTVECSAFFTLVCC